jgi:hypothetical protein
MWKLVALGVLIFGGVASAEPTARFGMTFGFDRAAAGLQTGPQLAVGERLGSFVGEVEYAYLSFFDAQAGIQRVGLTLRGDLFHTHPSCEHYACTRRSTIYAELGADERFGHWSPAAEGIAPASGAQPEAHLGFGLELDNELVPHRNGWQFGVRFELAPHGAMESEACRGASCMAGEMTQSSKLDEAVFLEWTFVLGG